jgi:hypothetical protein
MLEDVMKSAAGSIAVALVAYALSSTGAPARDRTLYQRLGGHNAIVAVVDDFVGNVAADKRINKFFAKANIGRLKARLVEQICQGSGGPCTYTGGGAPPPPPRPPSGGRPTPAWASNRGTSTRWSRTSAGA